MILSGRVVEVSTVPIGDVLTADHAAGATVLAVGNVTDFEGVAQVALVDDIGTVYVMGLLELDDEADTLTLASGLPVAFEADYFVAAYPLGEVVEAQVIVEDGDEALTARVPHTLIDRLAEGTRAEGEQEAVEVNDDGGEWSLVDVFGVVPKVDATYLDPATIPDATLPPEVYTALSNAEAAAASAEAARTEANAAQAAAVLAQQNAAAAASTSGAGSQAALDAQAAAVAAQAAALAADDRADAAQAAALASATQATNSAAAAGDSAAASAASEIAAGIAQQNAANSAVSASGSATTATNAQAAAVLAQQNAAAAQAAADAAAADSTASAAEVAAAQAAAAAAQAAAQAATAQAGQSATQAATSAQNAANALSAANAAQAQADASAAEALTSQQQATAAQNAAVLAQAQADAAAADALASQQQATAAQQQADASAAEALTSQQQATAAQAAAATAQANALAAQAAADAAASDTSLSAEQVAAAQAAATAAQALAQTAQQQAAASQTAAQTSAANASTAQQAAAASQTAAQGSATTATNANAAAQTAQQQASASATAAAASSSTATTAQQNAQAAQAAAVAAQAQAATSAQNATTSQQQATAAQNAATAANAAAVAAAGDASLSAEQVATAQAAATAAQNAAVLAQQNADAAAADAAESATAAAASASAAQAAQAAAVAAGTVTPPSAKPTIASVSGLPNSFLLVVDPVRPSDEIEVHLSLDPNFVPTPGNAATIAIPRTKSTVLNVAALPVSDAPLDPAATYYVRVFARNAAGSSPASDPLPAKIDLSGIEAVIAAKLIVGFILAGQISLGGDNITINPDTGITIKQPNGGVIRFPSNGTDDAEITAHLIAKTLAVQGNMSMAGAAQVLGSLTMSSGITAPKTAPTMSYVWPSYVADIGYDYGDIFYGLSNYLNQTTGALDDSWLVTCRAFYGSGITLIRRKVGPGGEPMGEHYGLIGTSTWASLNPVGGITQIGTGYYVLGYDNDRAGSWYIYGLDRNFVKTGEWYFCASGTITGRPAIGRDEAGNIVTAFTPTSTKNLAVQIRATSNPAAVVANGNIGATLTNNPLGSAQALTITGVAVGAFDLGLAQDSRIYVALGPSRKVYAYSASNQVASRVTSLDFSTAGVTTKGLIFDKADPLLGIGRFVSLDTVGNMHRYSAVVLNAAVQAQSTFYDADNGGTGQHETAPSPTATFTVPARAWARVTAAPAPDAANVDPTKLDKANRVRIYANFSSQGVPTLQSSPAVNVVTADFDTFVAGSAAPALATSFANAGSTPGFFASTATRANSNKPATYFDGAGAARADGLVPPGVFIAFGGSTQPAGGAWLLCNGQQYAESDYPELAATLGTSYTVSGVTPNRTMRTPDLRDRFISGAGTARPLHALGGSDSVTMPEHVHSVPGHVHGIGAQGGGTMQTAGAGTAKSNLAPYGSWDGHNHGGATGPGTAFNTGGVVVNPAISNVPLFFGANYLVKT